MRTTVQTGLGFVEGVGRLRLQYRCWEVDQPAATAIFLHGLFEHGGRYAELGEFLAGAGISCFAPDLRGHGASEGRRGHVRRFHVFLQDLDRVRREVQGMLAEQTPVFLIGHALGSLIGLRYVEEYDAPVAGGVFLSPCLGAALPASRRQALLAATLDRILPAFPMRSRRNPACLTHDPKEVRSYQEDPDVHSTFTPRLFTETSAAVHMALQRADRIEVPLHFLFAGDDRLIDTERSLAFARSLPGDQVTTRTFPGTFHNLLHERERTVVLREIRDWIHERLR
jgi:acylglycerol lipase